MKIRASLLIAPERPAISKEKNPDPNLENKNADPDLQNKIDLIKLEYETLADRYEAIYKALWQNFSFISLVATGILTFASNALQPAVAIFLAGLPFVFWFLGQYHPLNQYGEDAREELGKIEKKLNDLVPGADLSAYKKFHDQAHKPLCQRLCQGRIRVVEAMRLFFVVGLILWIAGFGLAFFKPKFFVKPPAKTEVKVIGFKP